QHLFGRVLPDLPFNHLPYEALLFVPLAALPFTASYYCWACVNVLMLLAVVKLAEAATGRAWPPLLVFAATLAFAPAAIAIIQGQDSILILLLYTLVFAAMK